MGRLVFVALVFALAACGGRKANPVEAVRTTDAQLTCAHIAAERDVNAARVSDLTGEARFGETNNFGLLLVSPLFLDLSDTVQNEIYAIDSRNKELDRLEAAKGC